MKIYAPVKDFNGLRNNVRFIKGVGETDNPTVIEWFITNGYEVESQRMENVPIAHLQESEMLEYASQPDFDSMTPIELREWAKENGFGGQIKNTRNKEKLLEIIRG